MTIISDLIIYKTAREYESGEKVNVYVVDFPGRDFNIVLDQYQLNLLKDKIDNVEKTGVSYKTN